MCGIVGMSFRDKGISNRKDDIRKLFTKMLIRARARGGAATGVVMMTEEAGKPKALVLRTPLSADKFVLTEEYRDLMGRLSDKTYSIIGHTRAATGVGAGASDNINNHPHIAGSIIGVHNGMFNNEYSLTRKYDLQLKSKCDSEVGFALINHKLAENVPLVTAVERALPELEGWFSLAFVNTKEPTKTYIVKDSSNPLALYWWPFAETAMFASVESYVEEPFKELNLPGALSEREMAGNTLYCLDSKSKHTQKSSDFFVSQRKIKMTDSVVDKTSKDYLTSQGRGRDAWSHY